MTRSFAELERQAALRAPDIPDEWKQGRTAYGGLSAALLLARVRSERLGLPPLRSALINFTGPVTEAPDITTDILRQGRNVTTVDARALIDGNTVCTGAFSFGASRESHLGVERPAPDAAPPEDAEPFHQGHSPFIPAFLTNFDCRLIEGSRPMTGGTRGYVRCWVRHRDAASRKGETALLCLADVLPPAVLPIMTQLGPMSSMSWICNFLRSPETDDGWYQVESELSAARDGYSSQVMRIWNVEGQMVAEGMQSITVFV